MKPLCLILLAMSCLGPEVGAFDSGTRVVTVVDAGPNPRPDAIDLTSLGPTGGHLEGRTLPGEVDAYGGGASCVMAGAPDRVFRVDVPAHRRVLIKAQAQFVARLYLLSSDRLEVNCNRTGANDGTRAQLAWFNASDSTQPLYFLLDWNGGLPNPSSIPNVGTFQVDLAFDSGAAEGESCVVPAALSLVFPTVVSVSAGQNDEGPGGLVDHVFTVTVPSGSTLTLSLASEQSGGATADVYVYDQVAKCGSADFTERLVVGFTSETIQRTFANPSAQPVSFSLVVEANATFDLGSVVITPTLTP